MTEERDADFFGDKFAAEKSALKPMLIEDRDVPAEQARRPLLIKWKPNCQESKEGTSLIALIF